MTYLEKLNAKKKCCALGIGMYVIALAMIMIAVAKFMNYQAAVNFAMTNASFILGPEATTVGNLKMVLEAIFKGIGYGLPFVELLGGLFVFLPFVRNIGVCLINLALSIYILVNVAILVFGGLFNAVVIIATASIVIVLLNLSMHLSDSCRRA